MEIKKQDSAFKNLYFVASALNLKSTRKYQTVLMVKNQTATGTDGHRLHQATVPLEDGFYLVMLCNKTRIVIETTFEDMNYPDLDCCICLDYKFHIDTSCINDKLDNAGAYQIALINRAGIVAPIKHIQFIVTYDNFEISYIDEKSPIYFTSDSTLKAYVMPIKPL